MTVWIEDMNDAAFLANVAVFADSMPPDVFDRLIALARIGAAVKPQMFDMLHGRYLCFDPAGRWHGWEFYKHPDGQFVSMGKREWMKPIQDLQEWIKP